MLKKEFPILRKCRSSRVQTLINVVFLSFFLFTWGPHFIARFDLEQPLGHRNERFRHLVLAWKRQERSMSIYLHPSKRDLFCCVPHDSNESTCLLVNNETRLISMLEGNI